MRNGLAAPVSGTSLAGDPCGAVPATVWIPSWRGPCPVFEMVTVCGALVLPMITGPKFSDVGETGITGPGPPAHFCTNIGVCTSGSTGYVPGEDGAVFAYPAT